MIKKWCSISLILRILIGLVIGTVLGLLLPGLSGISLLGEVFVGALKGIAPVLVFFLVASALSKAGENIGKRFTGVIFLYLLSTLVSAIVAVLGSLLFPITIRLTGEPDASSAPSGLAEVFRALLENIIKNPLDSLANANYLGILFWAVILGVCLKKCAGAGTLQVFEDLANAISNIVKGIIQFAPFGILGIVFSSVSKNGMNIFADYGKLVLLLVSCMLLVAFVTNPVIGSIYMRRNAYPLVLRCAKESGITAFFTRSSAANIPVNMGLCEKLGLDKDFYSVCIPLGATVNMNGAAVTITTMTLATCNTVGISVDFPTAIILCGIAVLGACGASGVAGGSLLLIPMACSLFGISDDIAMQVVAVGFIIGVIQDSMETALNSSSDVFFAAAAEYRDRARNGKPVNYMGEYAKTNMQ